MSKPSEKDLDAADAVLNSPMPDTLRHYLVGKVAEAIATARAEAYEEAEGEAWDLARGALFGSQKHGAFIEVAARIRALSDAAGKEGA